jgi:hypothetical protein
MRQQLRFLFLAVSILLLVAFLLFLFNQVMQIYTFTSEFNPALGKAVLWSLTLLLAGLLIVPFVLFFRLPKALPPPDTDEEKALYVSRLGRRLSRNKLLREGNFDFSSEAEVDRALNLLSIKADAIVQNTARSVFFTTAISQNGKLDALTVFITQTKMVWDLAHVYYQRPAPRDMLALYANVGAATFLAAQIEDLDFSEQLEPVFGTLLQNTALKSVPFVGSVTNVITDSLLEGTINAFLTLRVGVITKQYCGSVSAFNPKVARRAAFKEAAGMLRTLIMQSSGQVVAAIMQATKKAGADTVRSGWSVANRATTGVRNSLNTIAGKFRTPAEERVNPDSQTNP